MSKSDIIKQSINILDVLKSDGVTVIGNKCACPLHGGKSRTMWVKPDTNSFNCFSCGKGGTVIDYWMYSRGLDAKDAINSLLETYSLSATNDWTHIKKQQTERQKQLDKQAELDDVFCKLCDIELIIKDWIESHQPKTMDDEMNLALPRAYSKLLFVEYLIDILTENSSKSGWGDDDVSNWAFQQAKSLLDEYKPMLDKTAVQWCKYNVDMLLNGIDCIDKLLGGIDADEMSIMLFDLQPWTAEHIRGAWETRKII